MKWDLACRKLSIYLKFHCSLNIESRLLDQSECWVPWRYGTVCSKVLLALYAGKTAAFQSVIWWYCDSHIVALVPWQLQTQPCLWISISTRVASPIFYISQLLLLWFFNCTMSLWIASSDFSNSYCCLKQKKTQLALNTQALLHIIFLYLSKLWLCKQEKISYILLWLFLIDLKLRKSSIRPSCLYESCEICISDMLMGSSSSSHISWHGQMLEPLHTRVSAEVCVITRIPWKGDFWICMCKFSTFPMDLQHIRFGRLF